MEKLHYLLGHSISRYLYSEQASLSTDRSTAHSHSYYIYNMSTSTATTMQQAESSVLLAGEQQIHSAANDAKFQSLARGTRNGTLKLRGIPTFSDSLEKRKWMKEHMAAAFRYFGKLGYGEGVSGHISMRGTRTELSFDRVVLQSDIV